MILYDTVEQLLSTLISLFPSAEVLKYYYVQKKFQLSYKFCYSSDKNISLSQHEVELGTWLHICNRREKGSSLIYAWHFQHSCSAIFDPKVHVSTAYKRRPPNSNALDISVFRLFTMSIWSFLHVRLAIMSCGSAGQLITARSSRVGHRYLSWHINSWYK